MSGLSNVNINKVSGLNNAAENTDRISCLVCGGITVVDGAAINTLVGPFYSVEDAEAVGITKQYDTDNHVLVWHHINQFFRGFGEKISTRPAKPLYLYMVSRSTPLSVMCDKDSDYGVYKASRDSNGTIKRFMVVLNPDDAYTPDTDTNGFDADVADAINKAQECATLLHDEHAPVHIYLEGRDFDIAIAGDAIDLKTFEAENVSVVIAQDYTISSSHTLHNGYAAVGAYVGMVTSKPTIADSPAEVGLLNQGNIQDKANAYFTKYGFGNKELKDWSEATQNALADKAYVAVRTYAGKDGVYFTQSFTCAASTSDYTRSELNEVYNKANRSIYAAYLPLINTKVRLSASGYIPGNTAKTLEEYGDKVFRTMANNLEISNGKTYIDPLQRNDAGNATSLATTKTLKVKWKMQPFGKLEEIDGELGFTVSIE